MILIIKLAHFQIFKLKVMRHGDKVKNLSRTKAHRDALLSNLPAS